MSVPLPGAGTRPSRRDADRHPSWRTGFRGLLLDTHYGDKLAGGKVRTDFRQQRRHPEDRPAGRGEPEGGGCRAEAAGAARLRRQGLARDVSLPHVLRAGRQRFLSSALTQIHDFLATHPDDVVVIVNQDYVTPGRLREGNRQRRSSLSNVFKDFGQVSPADAPGDDRLQPAG